MKKTIMSLLTGTVVGLVYLAVTPIHGGVPPPGADLDWVSPAEEIRRKSVVIGIATAGITRILI